MPNTVLMDYMDDLISVLTTRGRCIFLLSDFKKGEIDTQRGYITCSGYSGFQFSS
jgi:hypothetical protein